MDRDVFIGEIQWDDQYELNQLGEELSKIVLKDGREYDWYRFGRELMTYEGFKFRLDRIDPSEEVTW